MNPVVLGTAVINLQPARNLGDQYEAIVSWQATSL